MIISIVNCYALCIICFFVAINSSRVCIKLTHVTAYIRISIHTPPKALLFTVITQLNSHASFHLWKLSYAPLLHWILTSKVRNFNKQSKELWPVTSVTNANGQSHVQGRKHQKIWQLVPGRKNTGSWWLNPALSCNCKHSTLKYIDGIICRHLLLACILMEENKWTGTTYDLDKQMLLLLLVHQRMLIQFSSNSVHWYCFNYLLWKLAPDINKSLPRNSVDLNYSLPLSKLPTFLPFWTSPHKIEFINKTTTTWFSETLMIVLPSVLIVHYLLS